VLNLLNQELVPVRYKAVPVKGASPVVYDPTATAPVFRKTLDEVFEGNGPMIRYFLQVVGYLMLGAPKEQIFLVIYGPSAGNGKNTLMDAIENVMGGYAMKLTPKAILESSHNNDSATPSTARMDGKRMVVVSEPSAKHQLDSGAVKSMVGDLNMPVRDNYESGKDIKIAFVLTLLVNKLPKVHAEDHGIWRRAKIIPFTRTFRGDEIDRDLPAKLRAEAAGILNLMLAGAHDYLINGLVEPEKVTAAIAEERESVDTIAIFLKDTMRAGVDDETPMKMIFQMYENWRAQNYSYARLTKQALGKGLVEKGYKKVARGHLVYHHGLIPIEIPDQS
jgi:P4 family phage/plasmid primase-like protien